MPLLLKDPHTHGFVGGFMFLLGRSECPDQFRDFQYADQATMMLMTEAEGAVAVECVPESKQKRDSIYNIRTWTERSTVEILFPRKIFN